MVMKNMAILHVLGWLNHVEEALSYNPIPKKGVYNLTTGVSPNQNAAHMRYNVKLLVSCPLYHPLHNPPPFKEFRL